MHEKLPQLKYLTPPEGVNDINDILQGKHEKYKSIHDLRKDNWLEKCSSNFNKIKQFIKDNTMKVRQVKGTAVQNETAVQKGNTEAQKASTIVSSNTNSKINSSGLSEETRKIIKRDGIVKILEDGDVHFILENRNKK